MRTNGDFQDVSVCLKVHSEPQCRLPTSAVCLSPKGSATCDHAPSLWVGSVSVLCVPVKHCKHWEVMGIYFDKVIAHSSPSSMAQPGKM